MNIMWRQTHSQTDLRPLPKPIWNEFTDLTITRNHAIDLFSGKIKVIVKEGNTIISNCKETRQKYHKDPRKLTVLSFDRLQSSDEPLSRVGFIGGVNGI